MKNVHLLGVRRGLDLPGVDGEELEPRVLVVQLVEGDEVGRGVLRLTRFNLRRRAPREARARFLALFSSAIYCVLVTCRLS